MTSPRRPRRRTATALVAALAVALAATLGGCAVGVDEVPRDIDRSATPFEVPPPDAVSGAAATGADRIFLLAPAVQGVAPRLVSVNRDLGGDPKTALEVLLSGPNATERSGQLRSALPAGLRLLDVSLRPGAVLSVDVSTEMQSLTGDGLIAALAQLVFTASELPVVDALQLLVAGTVTPWPTGSGELTSRPLTVYDYPGWVASTQPAYPGVPPA